MVGHGGRVLRASMRPGRERPGKVGARHQHGLRRSSFNEAGARTPRKEFHVVQTRQPIAQWASMRPGRERPGKVEHSVDETLHAGASMRPGRERPGKDRPCLAACGGRRCGFNEAGARTPRKVRPRCGGGSRLSRFNEAGARTPRKVSLNVTHCPPWQTRFNEAGARTPRKDGTLVQPFGAALVASMRPGRERPGKDPAWRSYAELRVELQ